MSATETADPGTPLAEDIIGGGAKGLAREIFGDEARAPAVYHLIRAGKLPVFRIGGVWHARRSVLRAHFSALEQASLKSA